MANEHTIKVSLATENGNYSRKQETQSYQADQTNPGGGVPGTIIVGTSEVDVDLSALTTPGFCTIKNLSSTATIQFGPKDTTLTNFAKLRPSGPPAFFEFDAGVTLRMISDEASTRVEVKCEET